MNWQLISVFVVPACIIFASAALAAENESRKLDEIPLRSLEPAVLLPDGKEFKTWESPNKPKYSRTYYVDGQAAQASDENPGTRLKPFKTINHAAQILQPGERVTCGSFRL
jgi:hypothetical protein